MNIKRSTINDGFRQFQFATSITRDPTFDRTGNPRCLDAYKVIFGTDFPILRFERTRQEIDALGLKPGPLRKLLRDNANRLYRLGLD